MPIGIVSPFFVHVRVVWCSARRSWLVVGCPPWSAANELEQESASTVFLTFSDVRRVFVSSCPSVSAVLSRRICVSPSLASLYSEDVSARLALAVVAAVEEEEKKGKEGDEDEYEDEYEEIHVPELVVVVVVVVVVKEEKEEATEVVEVEAKAEEAAVAIEAVEALRRKPGLRNQQHTEAENASLYSFEGGPSFVELDQLGCGQGATCWWRARR